MWCISDSQCEQGRFPKDGLLSTGRVPLDHAVGNSDHRAMNRPGSEPAPSRASALVPVEQARAYLLDRARRIGESERAALEDALGRVAAADVAAPIDVPGHANSAMDGYAVRAADVPDEGQATLRVTQRIAAGETGSPLVAGGGSADLHRGARSRKARTPSRSRRTAGSKALRWWCPVRSPPERSCAPGETTSVRGAVVLAAGTRIRPQEMGVVASVGIDGIEVRRRPRVAVVSSGNELRRPGEPLGPDKSTTRTASCSLDCSNVSAATWWTLDSSPTRLRRRGTRCSTVQDAPTC